MACRNAARPSTLPSPRCGTSRGNTSFGLANAQTINYGAPGFNKSLDLTLSVPATQNLIAGTYDDNWSRTRKPLLPRDFDRRFFNAAPPGLVALGYLKGNEPVTLLNASPEGRLAFSLPGQPPPAVTVRFADTEDVKPAMHLDTVILDADSRELLLLWRGHVLLREAPHEVSAVQVSYTATPRS